MERQMRAAAIHDISCFGKCSLTVALPILSATGAECVCLPTAVLSTHTGGFTGYTYRDLTEDMLPIARHWQTLDLGFDALYTGYLGSREQIALVLELFEMLSGPDTLRLVDPVMADHGSLYPGFDSDFPAQMKTLCAAADVVIPNLTEACLMLGLPYREGTFDRSYVDEILSGLTELGAKKAILTGVYFDDKQLGAACRDGGRTDYVFADRVEGQYHGTGDVWGSALLAGLLRGRTLTESAQAACDYTAACVELTRQSRTDMRFGVRFESALPGLMRALGCLD